MLTTALLLFAASGAQGCDLSNIRSEPGAYDALSRRAIEVFALSENKNAAIRSRLTELVSPSATVSFGGGDVRVQLETGLSGLRSLSERVKADRYQVLGWDYIEGPASACTRRNISVDFINFAEKTVSNITFTFDQGRVIAAEGWMRTFKAGSMPNDFGAWTGS